MIWALTRIIMQDLPALPVLFGEERVNFITDLSIEKYISLCLWNLNNEHSDKITREFCTARKKRKNSREIVEQWMQFKITGNEIIKFIWKCHEQRVVWELDYRQQCQGKRRRRHFNREERKEKKKETVYWMTRCVRTGNKNERSLDIKIARNVKAR